MSPANSSEYSYRPGGSLKFKGGSEPSGSSSSSHSKKKKKSSKSRSSTSKDVRSGERSRRHEEEDDDRRERSRDVGDVGKDEGRQRGDDSPALFEDDEDIERRLGRPMTASERKFEEAQRKRMAERIAKQARMSHKEKVDQFNKSLADRTEHNDMLTVSGH